MAAIPIFTKATQIIQVIDILKGLFPPDTIDAILDAIEVKNPKWIPLPAIVRQLIGVPDDDTDQTHPV